jgi:hypothetical protein
MLVLLNRNTVSVVASVIASLCAGRYESIIKTKREFAVCRLFELCVVVSVSREPYQIL